jgi:hypothetical protein
MRETCRRRNRRHPVRPLPGRGKGDQGDQGDQGAQGRGDDPLLLAGAAGGFSRLSAHRHGRECRDTATVSL